MATNDKSTPNGLERLNSLFVWWGIPNANGNGHLEAQLKRFQTFTSEMQKSCTEAFGEELTGLFAARERSIQAVQNLMRSRKPDEIVAAEAGILASLLEETALQAKRWATLTEHAHECCTALAQDMAKGAASPVTSEGKAASIREASRHAAHA